MSEPLLVDIKSNSLDDGPGIRSVVFFKGCPLSCAWCHNPETISSKAELAFDREVCVGSLACAPLCPEGALTPGSVQHIDRARCTRCFECVDACPSGALERVGRPITGEQLVAELLRDKPFFDHSGGGVTLSGGEPTLHMEFLGELLGRLKVAEVHTLLQTCGAFGWRRFDEQVYPHLDQVYFDLKLLDPGAHRQMCGADNAAIRRNFERLHARALAGGVPVLARVPLVPNATATPDNLRAVAGWLAHRQVSSVQLVPFNPLWPEKLPKLGLLERMPTEPPRWMSLDELSACCAIFQEAGLTVVQAA